jgi:hypothetical protein
MIRFKTQSIFFVIALACLSVLPAMSGNAAASTSWWNSAWSRRAPVAITETSGFALSDYQVKVVVPYDSDMRSDFGDVRFVDSASGNEVSYWLESKTDGSTATFWVKVPSIPASGVATIYMYYGNPSVSTTSNIHNTFIWGDDFENATWTNAHINMANLGGDANQYVANGTYNFTGSYVKPTDPAEGNASLSEPIAEIGPGGQPVGDYMNDTLTRFPANYIVDTEVES